LIGSKISSSLNHCLLDHIFSIIKSLSLSFCFFSLLHWCKDHSILSPTASHYDLFNWSVSLYVIHRDMRPCDRTSQLKVVWSVIWLANIQYPILFRNPKDLMISGFVYLWFTRKPARIHTRKDTCKNEEKHTHTHTHTHIENKYYSISTRHSAFTECTLCAYCNQSCFSLFYFNYVGFL